MKTRRSARPWLLWLWLALFLAGAAQVWRLAWPDLYQRACWLAEWPFEQGCDGLPTGHAPDNPPEVFQAYLQTHPGDGRAWAWWLRALWVRQDPATPGVLASARVMAPHETAVLMTQADLALQAGDWPQAAQALVTLTERGVREVRPLLLALMTHPQAGQALLALVRPEAIWLDSAIGGLDVARHPGVALSFAEAGQTLGALKPGTLLGLIDRLKRAGHWGDAYLLWVSLQGQVPQGLFNGDFETRLLRRGFDWEWTVQPVGRMGLRVQQASASPEPGQLLQLELTGRAALPMPLLAQTLWLTGERYRLSGRYRTDALRSQQGLVWALRCASGGERWASTPVLAETQRRWQTLTLDFEVPARCGAAVRLQLEPQADWEARAGMHGVVWVDDMAVVPVSKEGT